MKRNRRDGVTRLNLSGTVDAGLRTRFIELAKERRMSVSEALESAVKTWVQRRNVRRIDSLTSDTRDLTLEERLVASVAIENFRIEEWKKKARGTEK